MDCHGILIDPCQDQPAPSMHSPRRVQSALEGTAILSHPTMSFMKHFTGRNYVNSTGETPILNGSSKTMSMEPISG